MQAIYGIDGDQTSMRDGKPQLPPNQSCGQVTKLKLWAEFIMQI